ncbi:MAG: hypothetical protein NXI20_01995 [bacterium]|nr:hypothetical protein [bacterium]
MKKLLILLLMLNGINSMAQQIHPDKVIHLEFNKQSFYLPAAENFGGTFHPGVSGGIDFLRKEDGKKSRYLTTELGFYKHEYFQNSIYLLGGFTFQRDLGERFSWNYQPKAGYMHVFSPTKEFELVNGEYKQKKGGRATGMFGVSVGLDYTILPKASTKLSLSYQLLAEGPFAARWGVPIVPHTFLSIGIKTRI